MSRSQIQAKRLADYYRPRYANSSNQQSTLKPSSSAQTSSSGGGASAHLLEIGDLPDDLDDLDFKNMALGDDVLPPPPDPSLLVWDASALLSQPAE